MFWFRKDRPQTSVKSNSKIADTNRPAEREFLYVSGREVQVIRRAYRRSLGLTLQVNGRIRVSAPKLAPISRIQEFLQANAQWIETHLERYQSIRDHYPPKTYFEGEKFLYLGRQVSLKFVRGTGARCKLEVRDDELIVEVMADVWERFDRESAHPELAAAVVEFFSKEARRVLSSRLALYSERMGLNPSSVCFRSQKTRWGSCNTKGKISLNWRLIVAPLEVIDYVVVHELSHLRHYNHSQAFWDLVGTQVPGYLHLRQWLREHQYEADFLAKRSELHELPRRAHASSI